LKDVIVAITLIVLTALFFVQRYGTGQVGGFFGPIMIVWFAVLAVSGFGRMLEHPAILGAISPHHGIEFLLNHGHEAFVALGGVVLAGSGREAPVARRGHVAAR